MGRFLARLVALTLPGTLLFFGLWIGLLYYDAGREVNALARLAPVQCNSMIFGTSRSAQGINPVEIETHLNDDTRWFNFSFNLGYSPWCKTYCHAIKQKIECSIDTTGVSTFILSVDPWSLDEVKGGGVGFWTRDKWLSPCDTEFWRFALAHSNPLDVFSYGSGADLPYVIVHFIQHLRSSLSDRSTLGVVEGIQASGWLPNNQVLSAEERAMAIKTKINSYKRESIGTSWPGKQNEQALTDLVDFLKQLNPQPRIMLLRMPVASHMYALEGDRFPDASFFFNKLATEHQIEYLDANTRWPQLSDEFFNDGHHMSTEGSRQFSKYLAESVLRIP